MAPGEPMNQPTIAAPVSRHLSVADLERSIAFYRDVLGFEVRLLKEVDRLPAVAEAVCGPARVELSTEEGARDSTGKLRARGSAILFFQAHDVAAMRDAFVARGGAPSELENVNWIKMRMFEIRDPDGHALWFGQSFDQPCHAPGPTRQLKQIMPELPLDDVPAGVAYYCDVLGFHVNYAQDDLGVMDRDDVTILLVLRRARNTGIGSCYVYVKDADALHAELLARGANVQGEPISHPWGLRDFTVLDLERNQIRFGQPFE
jgi:catechol 2,3-dioxygenase-like lactoylglutathione lyase family enzyme